MNAGTDSELDVPASAPAELRRLRAENETLRSELRRARAVADGIELSLHAMTRRLVEAEARCSDPQRLREVRADGRRGPVARRWLTG